MQELTSNEQDELIELLKLADELIPMPSVTSMVPNDTQENISALEGACTSLWINQLQKHGLITQDESYYMSIYLRMPWIYYLLIAIPREGEATQDMIIPDEVMV